MRTITDQFVWGLFTGACLFSGIFLVIIFNQDKIDRFLGGIF